MQTAPKYLTGKQIALALGISERGVRKRARQQGWGHIYAKSSGRRIQYIFEALPDDVKAALLPARPGLESAARAGRERACRLAAEARDAARAKLELRQEALAEFARLPEERRREAEARHAILAARDAFCAAAKLPKKRGTELFLREYRAGAIELPEQAGRKRRSLSWATLYRWEKAWREFGLAGLAPRYKSTRSTGIPEHMRDFLRAMLVEYPHASVAHLRSGLEARYDGQQIPSVSAIRRWVNKWRKKNASLMEYLTNPDQWRSRRLVAFGDAAEQIERLNQLWEFDSTPGDVMLTDGRHTIIGVIDVYSRRGKLLVAPTSKATAVAALTRRALLDWGVPEAVKTDNGSDYVSMHVVRVFEDLEIEQILCPPFSPEKKPHIERFFHTFSHGIVELLPGYIGHSVADRKTIEARRSFAARLMDREADPVRIEMTSAELQQVCDRWCEAIYHQDSHSGLDGLSPAEVARRWTGPVRKITNERALDILLAEAPDNHGRREIRKKGIRVDNAWFMAPELAPHVGRTAHVLLDATDYGTIYVFLPEDDGRRTWLCKAVCPERTGHDRSQIAATARAVQKRVMQAGRRELKKLAREMAVDAISREILSWREKQIANVVDMPRPAEQYETPMLEQAARAVDDIRRAEQGPRPYGLTPDQEEAAGRIIEMAARQPELPANDWEKYEQLDAALRSGAEISDEDLAWMKRYELYLETGQSMAQ